MKRERKYKENLYICKQNIAITPETIKMKKWILLALKILGGLVALLLVVLVGVGLYANSSSGQQRLLRFATNLLQEKLETRVQIDSISVNVGKMDVNLWGVDVEDRQQRKMLQAERLAAKLDLKDLMLKKLEISSVKLQGIKANVYQPKDSAANYQFVIDAFKTDKKKKTEPKKKQKLALDLKNLEVTNLTALYNNHKQTTNISLAELKAAIKGKKYKVVVARLRYATDNHKPRKNANKPKRGFFDAGHLDLTVNMQADVELVSKDSTMVTLNRCTATDTITGIDISDLRLKAAINKKNAFLQDVVIQHLNTQLNIKSATVQLPSKKHGRGLEYTTDTITGRTLLKDIARPFAPALSRFNMPLELKLRMSGTDSTMQFIGVHVNTPDQKLTIDANGYINNLKKSKLLQVHFDVNKMATNAVTAKKIIDQFTVKKFMMRQMNNLGAIGYRGTVDVLYKMEKFKGVLSTSKGHMAVNLTLNDSTKYLTGSVSAKGFHLGKVVEMKDIGDVGCTANFTFDYSKPRTARVRKLKGGKLPIGRVCVSNAYGTFKKIKFSDINANIISDGVVAQGHIVQSKKLADVMCHFTFNNTDSIHKMKIKPGLRLKNMPWQKKSDKKEKKSEKKTLSLRPKKWKIKL